MWRSMGEEGVPDVLPDGEEPERLCPDPIKPVARMEQERNPGSASVLGTSSPDFAALHPGYLLQTSPDLVGVPP